MSKERAERLAGYLSEKLVGTEYDWDRKPRLSLPVLPHVAASRQLLDNPDAAIVHTITYHHQSDWIWHHGDREYKARRMVADGLIIDAAYWSPEHDRWITLDDEIGKEAS